MTYTLNGLVSVSLIAALVAGCSSYTTAQRPVVTHRKATTSVALADTPPADLASWESLGDVKVIGTGLPALTACEDHIVSEGRAVGAELAVVRPGSSGSECTATYYARRPPTTSGASAPSSAQ